MVELVIELGEEVQARIKVVALLKDYQIEYTEHEQTIRAIVSDTRVSLLATLALWVGRNLIPAVHMTSYSGLDE